MANGSVRVGIDVGGTKVLAVALDDRHRVTAERQVPTVLVVDELVERIATAAADVADGALIESVGLGIPAFIGLDGIPRRSPHLGPVVGVDIGAALGERLGVGVHVDNDANCAGWAAAVLDAPGARSVATITLGTGIGAGLVIDGRIVRGAHGFAGEPGHMVVDADGPECACGQHGCWEVWASGAGLGRVARRAGLDLDSPQVTAAAAAGSPEALAVLDRYGWWVAVGLLNVVNLLDPAVVVLGGGIVAEGDLVLAPVRRALDAFTPAAPVDLRIAASGPRAGAIGAAMLGEQAGADR